MKMILEVTLSPKLRALIPFMLQTGVVLGFILIN